MNCNDESPARRPLNLLLIAYVFPPALGSGSFRPLAFANQLSRTCVVHVLTSRDYVYDNSAMDEALLEQLDPAVTVHRSRRYRSPRELVLHARALLRGKRAPAATAESAAPSSGTTASEPSLMRRLGRTALELLSFPDNQVSWAAGAYFAARRIAARERIDVVYATGSPWSALVMAVMLGKQAKLPVVLDFRDPWVGNPNADSRAPITKRLHRHAEAFCVRGCDTVIANTELLRQAFLLNYPSVDERKFHVISNGFDPLEIPRMARKHKLTLTHAGALYLNRSPYEFLLAVRELIRSGSIPPGDLEIQFIGTLDVADERLATLLHDENVTGVLRLIPTAPHAEVLRYESAADVLLLLQPGFPLQVPRKVFEYFALHKYVLAIAEPDSATATIVQEAGVGVVVGNVAAEIAPALLAIFDAWRAGELLEPPRSEVVRFSNAALAQRLLGICTDLATRSTRD